MSIHEQFRETINVGTVLTMLLTFQNGYVNLHHNSCIPHPEKSYEYMYGSYRKATVGELGTN